MPVTPARSASRVASTSKAAFTATRASAVIVTFRPDTDTDTTTPPPWALVEVSTNASRAVRSWVVEVATKLMAVPDAGDAVTPAEADSDADTAATDPGVLSTRIVMVEPLGSGSAPSTSKFVKWSERRASVEALDMAMALPPNGAFSVSEDAHTIDNIVNVTNRALRIWRAMVQSFELVHSEPHSCYVAPNAPIFGPHFWPPFLLKFWIHRFRFQKKKQRSWLRHLCPGDWPQANCSSSVIKAATRCVCRFTVCHQERKQLTRSKNHAQTRQFPLQCTLARCATALPWLVSPTRPP